MKYSFRIALFVILNVCLVGYPVLTSAQGSSTPLADNNRIYLPLLSQGAGNPADCQLPFPHQSSSDEGMEAETLSTINEERAKYGSPALTITDSLIQLARFHSNDMAANNTMGHDGSAGESFGERISWGCDQYSYAGEIIAWGYSDPQSVIQGWLNSPGHRAILLDGRYSAAGVGYAYSEAYGQYWTVDFIAQVQAHSQTFEPEHTYNECRTFAEQAGEGVILATICD